MPTLLDPIYEILAKEVVYGYDRPEFSQLANAFLATTGYQIDQSFNDPNTGFQALGLTSTTLGKPPVLLFRGADEAIDDLANGDLRSIGFNQFDANRQAIATWLAKFANAPLKPDIVGHSLGGSIAQLVATEFSNQIGNSVTFNATGLNKAVADRFVQQGGQEKNVTHYVVKGDLISLSGESFIPGTVVLQSYTDPAINPIFTLDKHSEIRRLLTSPPAGFTQTVISVQDLSSANFNYNGDSDFTEFLAAYGAINPNVASRFASRGGTESVRTSPGFSFLGLILGARDALAPTKDNLLVGDDTANTADGAQGKDTIRGNGGNDTLIGGGGDDEITGGAGLDSLSGGIGKDQITGGADGDTLVGGGGKDTLIGVDPESSRPGRNEIDVMRGDGSGDLFGLGNNDRTFYDDRRRRTSGNNDYALIKDFSRGDAIQLRGDADDYLLKRTSGNLPAGVGVYLDIRKDELIGIVQGVTDLTLNSRSFRFV
ncbi:MAG: DUF2974 domain-containing protein [Cyanobacteria bacterium CRU_2_1]|nr:DUF2974 domain-containing protein [Cyanobacteria bacterium RU_5_0]NJR63986.1 DUF2974 domain-containing protein [Cyanobacteria bacterium CRU_2_1]